MHHRALASLVVGAVLVLAACSSSGSTVAPSAAAPSAEASTAAGSPAAGGAACSQSATAGQVAVTIKNFAFPATIQAKVGDTVTFTNGDSAPHTATLDDGSCSTGTISPGTSDGLTFTAPGTYAFHCKIHSSMKGTITVS